MGPNQTSKCLNDKGNPKQHKKTTHRMGENLCQESTGKELISTTYKHLLQLKTNKNKQPHQKMGRRSKQTVLQRRHTDGQETHEKMFNITHYSRNANENHHEVPPYTSQNGQHPKVYKQ